jgi:hypothetical protein
LPFLGSTLYLIEGFVSGYILAWPVAQTGKLTSVRDQSPTSKVPSNVRNRFDLKGISHPLSLPIVYDLPLTSANVKSVYLAYSSHAEEQLAYHADHVLLLL